jgi:DNA polymerase
VQAPQFAALIQQQGRPWQHEPPPEHQAPQRQQPSQQHQPAQQHQPPHQAPPQQPPHQAPPQQPPHQAPPQQPPHQAPPQQPPHPHLAAGPFASAAAPASSFGGAPARPDARPELVTPPIAGFERPAPATPALFSLGTDNPAPLATVVTGAESPEERRVKLSLLADEARACQRCGLHAQRKQAVFARGNPLSELCFVGEGPGADEDAQGLPFVGKAGQLLDRMINAMGYGRDDVYICNIVKCRPPENRKPEPNEMAACSPFLTAQLSLATPRVIIALGATALQGLTGVGEGITRVRGKWKLYRGIPIMPTFHPAYLLRQPAAKREVWNDLKEVMRFLGKTPPEKSST